MDGFIIVRGVVSSTVEDDLCASWMLLEEFWASINIACALAFRQEKLTRHVVNTTVNGHPAGLCRVVFD